MSLSEMVEKVSSMVKEKSVKTSVENKTISILTEAWEFNFEFLDNLDIYVYDSTTVVNDKLDLELTHIKKTVMREVVCSNGIINNT